MKTVKSIDTLTKELAALDCAELHELFNFYYRINHQHANLTSFENFNKFLVSFDKNPFRRCEDKDFRKQMIDNLIAYTDDHNINIEEIFAWFFEEYLPAEFSVDKFAYNVPSTGSSYLEKCKLIAGEIESVLKQFKHYQKHGHIDKELLEMSSDHLFFSQIPSLLSTKYVYAKSERVKWCIAYLFNDCMLGFFPENDEYEDCDCLYDSIKKHKRLPKSLFSHNYHQHPLFCLLDFGVLVETDGYLTLEPSKAMILRDLYNTNGKVQVIPLCSAMVSILRDYMAVREGEAADYLFCNEFGGFLTENALRLAIVKYNNSRGVERTSIHVFRHTFARKYLVDCGGDAFSLQQIMGHSTLKMTRHYCNIFNDDIIENHEQRSPLAQLTKSKRQTIKK